MNKVKCLHVYADSEGESHIEDVELDLIERGSARVSVPSLVVEYHFLSWRPGYQSDWHPVRRREVVFLLKGALETEVSDGNRRRSGPGDVWFVDATEGKGYLNRVVGDEDLLAAVVASKD